MTRVAMWAKNHSKMINCSVLSLMSIAVALQVFAEPQNSKESVVFARTNIYRNKPITANDLGVTLIERNQIPVDAIRLPRDAIAGNSLGIYCGQILVYKRIPSGPNAGVIDFGGYQPAKEIDRSWLPVKGKTGVMDLTGAWIIQPKYCEVHYSPKSKYFWVTNLQHLLSQSERNTLQVQLGRFVCSDIWQAFDYDGKPVNAHLPLAAQGIEWPVQGLEFPDKGLKELLTFRTQSGIGVCDDMGHTIISPHYESIDKLRSGRFLCLRFAPHASSSVLKPVTSSFHDAASWEIRTSEDKLFTKLPKTVWDAYDGAEDFLVCQLPNKKKASLDWGVLNQSGKIVAPPIYSGLHPFSEGLATVTSDTQHVGYIDRTGRTVIPLKYCGVSDFKNGVAFNYLDVKPAKRDKKENLEPSESKCGAIDRTGQVILPFEYEKLRWLPNNTIAAIKGNNSMVLDRKFKTLLKFDKNTLVYSWSEGRYHAFVHANERTKNQFLDENGNRIGPECEIITPFHGGHAVVEFKKGFYGVIDKQGRWVIPPKYADLQLCGDNRLIAEPPMVDSERF